MKHDLRIMRILPLAAVLLVGVMISPFSSFAVVDWQKGSDARQRGDYATALKELKPVAEQGSEVAQFILGLMYFNGQGVPQDYAEAAKWYRLAANQGEAVAQHTLGNMYEKGLGVPQDYAEAVKWYHLAAEQGYHKAKSALIDLEINLSNKKTSSPSIAKILQLGPLKKVAQSRKIKTTSWKLKTTKSCKGCYLRGVDLSGEDLTKANLTDADLSGANLSKASLTDADLSGANLKNVEMKFTNLQGAILKGADLSDAEVWRADLRGADLSGSKLDRVSLTDSNLSGANLYRASLRDADLRYSDMKGVDFKEADLSGAKVSRKIATLSVNLCRTTMPDGTLNNRNCVGTTKITKSKLKKTVTQTQTTTSPVLNTLQQQGSSSVKDRLAKLKELLEKGLIPPDEAAKKRKEILKGL